MEDKEQKIKIEFETNAEQVAPKINTVTKATDETSKAQTKASKSSKSLADGLGELDGPIGNTISRMKRMLKQMELIVANPLILTIAAIVGALTLVFKAFTSTNDGADKLEQIMAGLGATIDVLRDRFLKLISLDFVGAFSGFGDEVSAEFKKAADATKSLQDVEDAMRSLGVTRAKLDRDLSASKELITDENATYDEKKKAINRVREAEGKQTEQELANAVRKLKSIRELNALSDTSDEDLQKEADAQSAVYKLQKEQSDNKRALNKLDKKADNEEKARLKEITDAKTAAYKERLAKQKEANKLELEEQKKHNEAIKALLKEKNDAEQNLIKFNQDLNDKTEEEKLARQKERALAEIEALKQKGIDVANITRLNDEKFFTLEQELAEKRRLEKEESQKKADEKTAADKKTADEKALEEQKKIDEQVLAQKQAIEDAKVSITDKALNLFGLLAGKNKKLQKAALIAEAAVAVGRTITSTQAGNAAAIAQGIALSAPTGGASEINAARLVAMNNISSGISIASIIASTGKALSALGGGSAGGSDSGSGGSNAKGGSSATPKVDFQASSENQIANTLANKQNAQEPIKAYIVESDVTTAQSLANNRITSNSI